MEDKLDRIIELLEEMNLNILLMAQKDIELRNEAIDMVDKLKVSGSPDVRYPELQRLKK